MKRYYLSPIEQVEVPGMGMVYQAKLARYGLPFVAIIPTDPTTGAPRFPWALCIAGGPNHNGPRSDNAIDALPDFPLDAKMQAMQTATKARLEQAMARRGLDTSVLANADGYRDVLRHIGRTLEPAFSEEAFDVQDA